jgi:hypothetical protein
MVSSDTPPPPPADLPQESAQQQQLPGALSAELEAALRNPANREVVLALLGVSPSDDHPPASTPQIGPDVWDSTGRLVSHDYLNEG